MIAPLIVLQPGNKQMHKTYNYIQLQLHDLFFYRYFYSVSSTVMDSEELCNYKNEKDLYSLLGKSDLAYPPKFIRTFEQVVYGYDIGYDEICKQNLKGMAIVKFQLASKIIQRIKKTKRVSFSDHISNIGKFLLIE